jgi:hypothetical protein
VNKDEYIRCNQSNQSPFELSPDLYVIIKKEIFIYKKKIIKAKVNDSVTSAAFSNR